MNEMTTEQAKRNAALNSKDISFLILSDKAYFDVEEFLMAIYDVDDFDGIAIVNEGNVKFKSTGNIFLVPKDMVIVEGSDNRCYFPSEKVIEYFESDYFDIDRSYGYNYTIWLLSELAMKTHGMLNPDTIKRLREVFDKAAQKNKRYLYKLKDNMLDYYDNMSLILPKSVNVEICKSYKDIYRYGTLVEQKLTQVMISSDKELYFGDTFTFIGEAEVD